MALPLPIPEFKPAEPVPFYEAITWFRQQAPWISGSSWNTMASLAALKGDQISGTVLLAVLDDVWGQMDRAVAEGKPYGSFLRDVAEHLNTKWYQADSARLKLIYHNNVGGALMAGREARMSDPDIREARPFVLFDGIGDWRQTIDICKPRDGVIRSIDDVWWKENSPLMHHGAVESSTLIQTGRGRIPARDVRCGDSVLTHTGAYRKVTTAVHKYVRRARTRILHLDSWKVIRVTDEHPILRAGTDGFIWKRADSLKVGDVLLQNPDELGRSLRCGVVDSQDCPSLSDDQRITFQIPGPCFPPGMAFPVQLDGDLEFLKGNIEVEPTDGVLRCRNLPEDAEQVVLLWGEFFPESIGNATSAVLGNGNRGHGVLEFHPAAAVCADIGVGRCLAPEVMIGTAAFGNGLGRKSADLNLINSGSDRNAMLFTPERKSPVGPAVFPLKFSDTPVLTEVLGFNKVSANTPVPDVWSSYQHRRITSISVVVEDTQLSDFTVEEDESYVAGDIVLHNCRSGKVTLDEEDAAELGGVTPSERLVGLRAAQWGWGKPASWTGWQPDPANYHAPLMEEYTQWANGMDYIHEKREWDAKWQRYAAQQKFAADAEAARAAEVIQLKSAEAELNDPTKPAVWHKQPKYDGLKMNGIPIQPAHNGYWSSVADVATGEPALPTGLGSVSTGILVMEDDGRIWVVEPKDHFGGYQHTFPKGKLEAGLSAQQNALKELYEEAGLSAEITGYVGDFKGTTGVTRYYLAKRTGGQPWTAHWESQAVKAIPVADAEQYLNTERDREVVAVLMAKKTGSPLPPGLKTYVAPATSPAPASPYPFGLDPAKYVYSAPNHVGSTPKMVVVHPDAPGDKFLLKQLTDEFKAHAEVAGGKLYGLVNDDVVNVEMMTPSSLPAAVRGRSKLVTLQKMTPNVTGLTDVIGHKSAPDFTKLTPDQQAELIAHGIASWMAGEHDGHAEQYLISGGKLVRIDMGQALKYTLSTGDKLELDYHPNAAYGEARPAHLQLLKAIKAGQIDSAVLYHSKVKAAAERASKVSEAAIVKALGGYGDLRPYGYSKTAIAALLKKRSENVKKDWADLFEQVTGAPYSWDATAKPKPKPKPRVPQQAAADTSPPKLQPGVDFAKAQPALESFGAVTVMADGDKLRGQTWRVQRADVVSATRSEARYSITGELDQSIWPELERTLQAKGARSRSWESYGRVGMFDPTRDTARDPVKKFDAGNATGFLGKSLVYTAPDGSYRVTFADSSAYSAMRGRLRIEALSADPGAAQDVLGKALKDLGLDQYKLDSEPDIQDTVIARAARALWNIEGGAYRPPRTVAEAKQRLKAYGVTKIEAKQNSVGYEEPSIPGRWKGYRQKGVRFLYHQFSPKAEVVRGVSGADGSHGGLLSTVARYDNGIIRTGLSSSDDLYSGGANSAFARIIGDRTTSAARSWSSSYHYTAIVSPRVLDRVDWYGYNSDKYGITTGVFDTRQGADAHVETVVKRGANDNEMMFRNAIAREDILFFAVPDDGMRTNMLATLSAAGVTTIRGQALDEMVVVMRTPNDYSRLNANNPVHAFLMGTRDTCPEWTETYGGTP